MQRLSLLLAALVLCAVLLVSGCGDNKQPNPAASAPPPAVTVVKVTAAEIKPTTTFTGRIEARNKVDLRARVDGFLEKRLFTEGADVAESDLLFVIEKDSIMPRSIRRRLRLKRRNPRSSSPISTSIARPNCFSAMSRPRRHWNRPPPSRARLAATCWRRKRRWKKPSFS